MDKILPAIISTATVILLFIIGRILDSMLKANETRRNWYQKVIIDPNISKIPGFYHNIVEQIRASIESLVSCRETLSFDSYISAKAIEINKIKNIKREFDYDFVQLVQTNFPEIAEELSEHLRDLEDCITQILDRQNLNSNHFIELEKECISRKHLLYSILYKPLKYKRPSLRRFFKEHYSKG